MKATPSLHAAAERHHRSIAPDAVICYANDAAFGAGQCIINARVESRMILWCKAGQGQVVINGTRYEVHPGQFFFLPWPHRIEYYASRRDPFLVAGIHLVPKHVHSEPVEFHVPHTPTHPLAGVAYRQDADLGHGLETCLFRLAEDAPLRLLCEYALRRFQARDWQEDDMRLLGVLVIDELARTRLRLSPVADQKSLADFSRLTEFVSARLHTPLAVADLARFMKCSESTLVRLVRAHTQQAPLSWLNRERMHRARTLLTTTRSSVAAIGAQTGFPDPFYFSKVFKKLTGESPLAYRKQTPMI